MHTINVKFVATELAPGLNNGNYNVDDGTSVMALIKQCEEASGATVPEGCLKLLYPLFNSKPVRLETPLNESGTLHFCRVVLGG